MYKNTSKMYTHTHTHRKTQTNPETPRESKRNHTFFCCEENKNSHFLLDNSNVGSQIPVPASDPLPAV